MSEPFELRNNLRLDKDGNIYCEDGQNAAEYIANDAIGKVIIPSPIVILTREEFFRLCCEYDMRKRNVVLQEALLNGLILAA